jgi:hypothetical protein
VIGHYWASLESISILKHKVSYISDTFLAQIPPKKGVVYYMAKISFVISISGCHVVEQSGKPAKAVAPPVDILSTLGVIGHALGVLPEQFSKSVNPSSGFFSIRTMVGSHVVTDLKSGVLETEHPLEIVFVFAGSPPVEGYSRSAERPD